LTGNNYETNLLERAWSVRRAFFPDRVEFVNPEVTLAVSVTGNECALKCAHCNGRYLQNMVSLEQALQSGYKCKSSYLVSGGCDSSGKVPLMGRLDKLKELKKKGLLNLHTGLVEENEAKVLGDLAEVISFDFPGDDQAIADIYGLQTGMGHYLDSYRYLVKYSRVVPHICIGLNGGKVGGEERVLDMLQGEAVEAISMIIFRPTEGTVFSNCRPPFLESVALFIARARLMFPSTPLYLGCMRPGGRYREKLDLLAIKAGINKIVLPSPAARKEAVRLGLQISHSRGCCSL
jgi:hypothetical protein